MTATAPEAPAPVLSGTTVSLPVEGFDPALVSFPAEARSHERVVVVAHGAGVPTEDICRTVRTLLGERFVLLCLAGPRIASHDAGRYFPDHHVLERIFVASLGALLQSHGALVAPTRATYVGYSQGATMGALMLPAHGDLCRSLVLIEGGFSEWTLARATDFRARGGERVLFACGTRHCQQGAEHSAAILKHAGLEARVLSDLSAGHTYAGALAAKLATEIDWALEDRTAP